MVKKILIGSLVTTSFLFANNVKSINVDKKHLELKNVKTSVIKGLGLPEQISSTLDVKKLKDRDTFGFKEYLLTAPRLNPMIIYYDKQKDIYMLGMILKDNKNVTAEELNNLNAQVYLDFVKKIPNSFKFTLEGKGKGKIYLFTDPECPYCKQAEKKGALKYLLEKYKYITIINYPLQFHREANERVFYVSKKISSAKTNEEKIKIFKEGIHKDFDKIKEEVGDYKKCDIFADSLKKLLSLETPNRFGTPMFINDKGKNISQEIMQKIFERK